ncbi:putative quinol monooxygenase [Aeromicrobium sp.]|uniref:putative quinol monooxygenase n=1 Tax=Aeromicrobium sp. TaxID=1871063 RepID=UPI003C62AC96
MSIHVVAVITAKPGSQDVVRDALTALVAPTRDESGCIAYVLSESSVAPGTFITVEEWEGPENLDSHLETPHVQSALSVLGSELAVAPAIHPLTPIAS